MRVSTIPTTGMRKMPASLGTVILPQNSTRSGSHHQHPSPAARLAKLVAPAIWMEFPVILSMSSIADQNYRMLEDVADILQQLARILLIRLLPSLENTPEKTNKSDNQVARDLNLSADYASSPHRNASVKTNKEFDHMIQWQYSKLKQPFFTFEKIH